MIKPEKHEIFKSVVHAEKYQSGNFIAQKILLITSWRQY